MTNKKMSKYKNYLIFKLKLETKSKNEYIFIFYV